MSEHTMAQQPQRLKLTVRGRRVLATLVLMPIALLAGVALAQIPSALASDGFGAAQVEQFERHTVLAGESLWQIAETIAVDHDVRDVVAEIIRLNGLTDSSVQAGQQLALPNL